MEENRQGKAEKGSVGDMSRSLKNNMRSWTGKKKSDRQRRGDITSSQEKKNGYSKYIRFRRILENLPS